MRRSFRLVRVAGIDIKVHITFFIVLVLGALPWGAEYGLLGALFGMILILLLFACVTLHELGHSLVAQLFDIPVREIILLPIGGVAFLGRNPGKPLHELLIAIAGPLVNVVIAVLILLSTGATAYVGVLDQQGTIQGEPLAPSFTALMLWLLQANVALVVFNLIPALPLDGGRVLRAILAMSMTYQRATQIASTVGQALAVGLGLIGLFAGNFVLMLVAAFIFIGAGRENVEAQARTVLTTLRVGDAYNRHALRLEIGDRVSKVVDYILTSYQPDFAVMQGNNPIGIVTRDDVLRALDTTTEDVYVTMIMRRDIVKVDASASLDAVRQLMSEKNVRVVAVYDGVSYLGLVSLEDIAEAFAVISFLQRQRALRQAQRANPRIT